MDKLRPPAAVKLLHTSDWHLGAKLGRHPRLDDQKIALRALCELAESERPDLILHTGDLFDSFRPAWEVLRVGMHALQRLSNVATTLVVSGNHDSPQLFRVLDEVVGTARGRPLRFVYQAGVQHLPQLADKPVAVACVPFVRPGAVVDWASEDISLFAGSYSDGIRNLNEALLTEAEEIAGRDGYIFYAAHLHVHGARPGRSERMLTVGEDYATNPEGLHRALYAAFGHIHDAQLIPGGVKNGQYAGSLIHLDFGEKKDRKKTFIVTTEPHVHVQGVDLPRGRPLYEFDGSLTELEEVAREGGLDGCILKARVESDVPITDLADRLESWSPGCFPFNVFNHVPGYGAQAIDERVEEEDSALPELFLEWRQTAAGKVNAPHDAVKELFDRALTAAGEGRQDDFDVTALEREYDEVCSDLSQGEEL